MNFVCCDYVSAQIAVLKSNSSLKYYEKNNLGNYDQSFNDFLLLLDNSNLKYNVLTEDTLSPASISQEKVLILPLITDLSQNAIDTITQYTQNNGKIIVVLPDDISDTAQKLANLVDVDVTKITATAQKSSVNWIDLTNLVNNEFPVSTKVTTVQLKKDSKSIAIWGQLEENITAVSISKSGSYIDWKLGSDGDKDFNANSLKYVLNSLDPNVLKLTEKGLDHNEFSKAIDSLNKYRDGVLNYLDNSYDNDSSRDLVSTQEQLFLAKLNTNIAEMEFNNSNFDKVQKILDNANNALLSAYMKSYRSQSIETRSIWVDRGTVVAIKSQPEMAKLFDQIQKSGINIVYFETLNAGYSIYPSKITKQTPQTVGYDPLKWAIEEAHRRNIKIHAWTWIFAVGNNRHNSIINKPQAFEGPVLINHRDWALLGKDGNMLPSNQHEFWISPANKKGKEFILSILEEIVKNYDVDGVQLDYIRYPFQSRGNLMGYDAVSRYEFEKATGYKLDNPTNVVLYEWCLWKANNVNDFVKTVSQHLRSINPQIKISAAVFGGNYDKRLGSIQQDWETWTQNGWVDILNPMIYAYDTKKLTEEINYFNSKARDGVFVLPGIAIKNISSLELLNQLSASEKNSLGGTTLFATAHLTDDKNNVLSNGAFKDKTAFLPIDEPVLASRLTMEEFFSKIRVLDGFLGSPDFTLFIASNEIAINDSFKTLEASPSIDNISLEIVLLKKFRQCLVENLTKCQVSDFRINYLVNYIDKSVKYLSYKQISLTRIHTPKK